MNANQESLFENHNKARYGDNPRHQNLFLPKPLASDARSELLRDDAQESAYSILKKWADLIRRQESLLTELTVGNRCRTHRVRFFGRAAIPIIHPAE